MAWLILFIAGLFETAWVVGMKYSDGFTKTGWSIFTIICILISMGLLSYSIKELPVGSAYAVWTGIGAAGTAVLGIILFDESNEFIRLFFIFMIIAGIIGLKIFSSDTAAD
ncbi:MAG: quaternary ammonium compound efflux SMR transporter SugE [Ignavibacteriaceae bacterium]